MGEGTNEGGDGGEKEEDVECQHSFLDGEHAGWIVNIIMGDIKLSLGNEVVLVGEWATGWVARSMAGLRREKRGLMDMTETGLSQE